MEKLNGEISSKLMTFKIVKNYYLIYIYNTSFWATFDYDYNTSYKLMSD